MSEYILFGTSGHARVIADIIKCNNEKLKGCLSNTEAYSATFPILGTDAVAESMFFNYQFIIGVGDNGVRQRIASAHRQLTYAHAIHPAAIISEDAVIGKGTVVMAGAIINAGARIGEHCIINSGAIVEHDCQIGDFSHISPRAALGGGVIIGDMVHVGIGAVVKNTISICNNTVIGAGATVVKDIDDEGIYIGVPAKKHNTQK